MSSAVNRLAAAALCLALGLPAHADDAARIVGGILGAIVNEQARQQQQRDLQRQQQYQQQQYQQQQYQQQQQRRQQNAQRQAAPAPQQPRLSLAERKAVQRALREAGFYGGKIDGALGPGSRKAIAAWQDSVGAAATGYLAPRQAKTLVATAPAPEPEYYQDYADSDAPGWEQASPADPETALFPEAPSDIWAMFSQSDAVTATTLDPAVSDQGTTEQATVIRGGNQLYAAYLFWALSRAPEQMWEPKISVDYIDMLTADGNPPTGGMQPAELRPLVEAAVARYGANPPRLAVLDLRMGAGRNDTDEKGLARRPTHWFPELRGQLTDISGVPAITEWTTAGPRSGLQLQMTPEKPFFLPVPADYRSAWAQPITTSGDPFLRVEIELTGLEPSVNLAGWPMGKARIAIRRATLMIASAKDRATGAVSERVLHVWTGEAPKARAVDRPATAAQIAAIYGVVEQDGRILTSSADDIDALRGKAKARPQALLLRPDDMSAYSYASRGGTGWMNLERAMRLAALIDAGPDRPLDIGLAQLAANTLLTKREQVDLLPAALVTDGGANYQNGLSELSVRKAMNQAEPGIRRLVSGRAPQFPLPLRSVMQVHLGEYDFDEGGFPLSTMRMNAPLLPELFPRDEQDPAVPRFFRIDADNAEKLLAHLNRSGMSRQRTIYLVADYAVTAMRARPGGGGPISQAELETVTPQVHVEALALFADPDARTRLRNLTVPAALAAPAQGQGQSAELPDEIFATSGKSLMAAVAVRRPDALKAGLLDPQDIKNLPADRRGNRAQDYRAELSGLARDSYWIAALIQVDGYDAELGGFPARQVELVSVPYAKDLSGVRPPNLHRASRADYELLRVPADQAEAVAALIDGSGTLRMFLNVPVVDASATDGQYPQPTLTIGAPTEAIIGQGKQFVWPDAAELRVALDAPDRLAWVTADPARLSAVPEALMLDPEGLDLLALSLQPDLYDDAGYRRMLLQRLVKENVAARGGALRLDWDRFFRDPNKPMEESEIDAMLPAFRDWTLARAAALPQRVLLPMAEAREHPLTGCVGASELGRFGQENEHYDRLFIANAQALLGHPLPRAEDVAWMNSSRPRPGPTRMWTLGISGRGPASGCQFLQRGGKADSGSYAGLLLEVEAQPVGGQVPDASVVASSDELELTERRLVPADQIKDAPEDMRAMLVLKARVQGVQLFGTRSGSNEVVQVGHWQPDDWKPVAPTPPAAQDVLGMTLGMTLADFDKAARVHLPQADPYVTVRPGKGPFGSATGYVDTETGEALAAVYAAQSPDKTVVAIMRQLEFPEGEISLEGLKASLIEKYGPAITESSDRTWTWGTLPPEEDSNGLCGGDAAFRLITAEGMPEMGNDDPAVQARAQTTQRGGGGFFQQFGWPSGAAAAPGVAPELSRCGPAVTVMIHPYARPNTILVRLWLMNRKLAEDLHVAAKPAEPVKPKVKF